jgi:hypothetical protein
VFLILQLTLAVKQQRLHTLEGILLNCSDPTHTHWGKHLSLDEVNDLVAPLANSVDAVEGWIKNAGLDLLNADSTPNKDFISLWASAAEVKVLLGITYQLFKHAPSGKWDLRADDPKVPPHVSAHIDFVVPTAHILALPDAIRSGHTRRLRAGRKSGGDDDNNAKQPTIHHHVAGAKGDNPVGVGDDDTPGENKASKGSSALKHSDDDNDEYMQTGDTVTPKLLFKIYNEGMPMAANPGTVQGAQSSMRRQFGGGCKKGSVGQVVGQAVGSFLEEAADIDGDLQEFFKNYAPEQSGKKPAVHKMKHARRYMTSDAISAGVKPYGAAVPTNKNLATSEASLDIQYLMAMGAGVPTELWATSG